MFESLFSGFDTDIFDEFKRLESEMLQLFGSSPWPAGIRAMQRGAFPPLNVGTTPERVDVYLFAAGLDPRALICRSSRISWRSPGATRSRWTRRPTITGASASMGTSGV